MGHNIRSKYNLLVIFSLHPSSNIFWVTIQLFLKDHTEWDRMGGDRMGGDGRGWDGTGWDGVGIGQDWDLKGRGRTGQDGQKRMGGEGAAFALASIALHACAAVFYGIFFNLFSIDVASLPLSVDSFLSWLPIPLVSVAGNQGQPPLYVATGPVWTCVELEVVFLLLSRCLGICLFVLASMQTPWLLSVNFYPVFLPGCAVDIGVPWRGCRDGLRLGLDTPDRHERNSLAVREEKAAHSWIARKSSLAVKESS
ncbi:hypothetical protein C8J57DRAFT_1240640 [Mycena rebaudengoi]|nr:hypothetical protein C8J57DRAFT_1240640 [Mycena rebaudengoi]